MVGSEGRRWLDEISAERDELVRLASRLRKQLPAERCRLVLEQTELRRRGRQKFSAAERMFFTPTGLEQATDEWIAAYKAARFPADRPLLDFCCGIGGDLVALARRGPTTGVDRSEVAVLLAEANLAALGIPAGSGGPSGAKVCDVEQVALDRAAAWHIDPDRRPQGRRTTRVELHEPGLPVIESLLHACGAGAIKLAPAAEPPAHWQRDAELEWISRGGQCRQLVAWFGELARAAGLCRASVVRAEREECGTRSAECGAEEKGHTPSSEGEQRAGQGRGEDGSGAKYEVRTVVGRPSREIPVAARMGRYLAEPDAAVLAADLTAVLAAERKLAAIAPGSVYLTGDEAAADLALAWFEIEEVLPFDVKRLKVLLRDRGCGRLEIKKRGVPHDPEQVRRQLRVPGENAATLFITRMGDAVIAVVARRITSLL